MRRPVVCLVLLLAVAGSALSARNDFCEFVSGVHQADSEFRFKTCLNPQVWEAIPGFTPKPKTLTALTMLTVPNKEGNVIFHKFTKPQQDALKRLQGEAAKGKKVTIITVIEPRILLIGGSTAANAKEFEFNFFYKKSVVGKDFDFKGYFCHGSTGTMWYKIEGSDWVNVSKSAAWSSEWKCLEEAANVDLKLVRGCLKYY